jgi:hypothetical protein
MKKVKKKKPEGKLVKRTTGAFEPLTKAAHDVASVMDWLNRLEELPLKQKNKAIRENPLLIPHCYGALQANGDLLVNPLAAEHQGNRDEGEYAFLTILKPLRDRLIREYEIKTGAEFMLLDAVVLSYYQYLRAATRLHTYTAYGQPCDYEVLARYVQPYLARANEMFLRNLEALRQMKAVPFVLRIEQAAQVNVGQKQLNVSGKTSSEAMGIIPSCEAQERSGPSDALSLPAGTEQP